MSMGVLVLWAVCSLYLFTNLLLIIKEVKDRKKTIKMKGGRVDQNVAETLTKPFLPTGSEKYNFTI